MYAGLKCEDFRTVFRLLGECSELWLDPAAWQDHLLGGVSQLIQLPVGLRAEIDGFASRAPVQVIEAREHGWEDAAWQSHYATMMRRNGPFANAPLDVRFRDLVTQHGNLTLSRADVVGDHEWHRSEEFNLAHRPARMDEVLYSAIPMGRPGRVHLLAFGGAGHRPTRRDRELLDLLHNELVPLIGSRLTTEAHYSMHGLSPRRREILALVAAGLPEKLIAERLRLRASSVNEQMQALYLHFGVHGRARLMAYLLNRQPAERDA